MSTRISRPKKATLAVLAGMVAAGPIIGQASAFAADGPPAVDTTSASTKAHWSKDQIGKTFTMTARHSGKTLHEDIAGKKVVQYKPNGGLNEQWTVVEGSLSDSVLLKNKQSGLCMTDNNDSVFTAGCNASSPNQNWQIYTIGGKTFQIESATKDKIIDVPGNNQNDNIQAGLWKDNDGDNQQFVFVDTAPPAKVDLNGKTVSILNNSSGKAVDKTGSGRAIAFNWHDGFNQKWKVEPTSQGGALLKQGDRCLELTTGGAVAVLCNANDYNQRWKIQQDGATYKLTTDIGWQLGVDADGQSLVNGHGDRSWIITPIDGSPNLMDYSHVHHFGFAGSPVDGSGQIMVRNNTDKPLYIEQTRTSTAYQVFVPADKMIAPGEITYTQVNGDWPSFTGAKGALTFKTADGKTEYKLRYDNSHMGDHDAWMSVPKSDGTAKPMYLTLRDQKDWYVSKTGSSEQHWDVPRDSIANNMFLSIGAPDTVGPSPLRGPNKCQTYANAAKPNVDFSSLWGSNMSPHMARFLTKLIQSGSAGAGWGGSIADGSGGAKLGGLIGGFIAGCNPFKDSEWRLVDAIIDSACNRPNPGPGGCLDTGKQKPAKPKLGRTATGTGPLSVNSFGNDYTAKPGDVLGNDGKDGLKAKILREGEPARDVEVQFEVPADSGLYFKDGDGKHVTTVTVTTDDNGEAVAQPLHAGDKEGDFTVTMTAANEPGATEGEHPSGTYTVHVKK